MPRGSISKGSSVSMHTHCVWFVETRREVEAGAPPPPPIPAPWEVRSAIYAWGYEPPWKVVVRSTVYLWGYGKPVSELLQNEFVDDEAARQLAAARGWDEARAGAWAKVIRLPLEQSAAQEALEPILQLDAAVVGWEGRAVAPKS
jgi:hypothetical protein